MLYRIRLKAGGGGDWSPIGILDPLTFWKCGITSNCSFQILLGWANVIGRKWSCNLPNDCENGASSCGVQKPHSPNRAIVRMVHTWRMVTGRFSKPVSSCRKTLKTSTMHMLVGSVIRQGLPGLMGWGVSWCHPSLVGQWIGWSVLSYSSFEHASGPDGQLRWEER